MVWFSNLRTAHKLLVFFGLMLVTLAITGAAGARLAMQMRANQEATYEVDLKTVIIMQTISEERLRIARNIRDGIIQTDPVKIASYMREVDASESKTIALFDRADAATSDVDLRAKLADVRRLFPEFMRSGREAVALSPQGASIGDPPKMMAALEHCNDLGRTMDGDLSRLIEASIERAAARAEASKASFEHSMVVDLVLFAMVVVAGSALTFIINRAVSTPLQQTVKLLASVAKGDLTGRLDLHRTDEIGEMATALNSSLESMRTTLLEVTSVSADLSSASGELAANAQQISAGAQEQAASLEETAASLEEISSTVKQNTDNAQEASQLANSARDSAERGGQVVSSAVSAMEEITRSSKKIADIITTIDEIAFQTNLLALNAAVEAARAGEQGRGFGVVAAEVRTLAQRTGTAAKEIRGLIADSSAKVEVGTNQVNESGRTLEEIVRSVKRVTDMVAEIAAASREQNTGLDQVNTAVTQVDQVTQSNAAQTEELSATATALSDKATELRTLVAAFELGTAETAPAPVRLVARTKPQMQSVRRLHSSSVFGKAANDR